MPLVKTIRIITLYKEEDKKNVHLNLKDRVLLSQSWWLKDLVIE